MFVQGLLVIGVRPVGRGDRFIGVRPWGRRVRSVHLRGRPVRSGWLGSLGCALGDIGFVQGR